MHVRADEFLDGPDAFLLWVVGKKQKKKDKEDTPPQKEDTQKK